MTRSLIAFTLALSLLSADVSAVHARTKKRIDVLVVDLGLRRWSGAAARLRTLIQVLAPGIEVKRLHYRLITKRRLDAMAPRAIVLSPPREAWASFPKKRLQRAEEAIRGYRRPVLGVGGGHQFLALAWGGELGKMTAESGEFGEISVRQEADDPLFEGIPKTFKAFVGHRQEITTLPAGFVRLATGDDCAVQAMRHETRPVYGVQFRPEDPRGARLPVRQVLLNFLKIAGLARD